MYQLLQSGGAVVYEQETRALGPWRKLDFGTKNSAHFEFIFFLP